jgi:hypothetical protein
MSSNKKNLFRLIDNAEDVQKTLRDDKNRPISMADEYRILQERFQLDFSASIRLFELLPVFSSGPRHKELRKEMAKSTATLRPSQEIAVKNYVHQLDKLLIPNVVIDLKNQFIKPLWRDSVNIQHNFSEKELDLIEDISLMFNRDLSINKRLAINNRLVEFIFNNDSDNELALLELGNQVLGFIPLIESITISLFTVFKNNIGVPLNAISYSSEIPASAVSGTARWVGDMRVRCPLHSPDYTKENNQKLMFGHGSHSCLGGPISRFIWLEVIKRLALSPLFVDSTDLHFLNPPIANADLKQSTGDNLIRDTVTRTENFKLILRTG